MTLTNWQAELGTLVLGAGTPYEFSGPIGGLGPTVASADISAAGARGARPGADVEAVRRLALPLTIGLDGDTPAEVEGRLDSLKAAWSAQRTGLAELEVRLAGATPRVYRGRPRGMVLDLTNLPFTESKALLTFDDLDGVAYGEEVVVDPFTSGDLAIAGTAATRWWRIEAETSGGDKIESATDPYGGGLYWRPDATGGAQVIDGDGGLVLSDATGAPIFDLDYATSQWFSLWPGLNDLAVSGLVTPILYYRPAYH